MAFEGTAQRVYALFALFAISTLILFVLADPSSIVLFSPQNDTYLNVSSPSFQFNVTGGNDIYSCGLFINGTGYDSNASVQNDTLTEFTANDSLGEGYYSWYVNCTNETTLQSQVRYFTVDLTSPALAFVLPTANNSSTVKFSWVELNVTIDDSNFDTFILNWNGSNTTYTNSSWEVTKFNSTRHLFYKNITNGTGLSEGQYTYYGWANDSAGNSGYTENFSESSPRELTVTYPDFWINIISPGNDTNTTNQTPGFNFTVNGSENTYSCELLINDTGYGQNSSTQNGTETMLIANSSLNYGNYTWKINCNSAGTTNTSGTRTIAIQELNLAPNKPELNSPENQSTGQPLSLNLNVTVTDPNGDAMNVSFYNNATGEQINTTQTDIANGSTASVIWYGLDYSTTYYWYANATDGLLENQSEVWKFTTKDAPVYFNITINSPANSTLTNDTTPEVNFTVSGTNPTYNCSWTINGTLKGYNASVQNNTPTFMANTTALSDGYYVGNVTCQSGETGNSTLYNFTIDGTPPQVSV
ncbi:MAG: hypothetical protein ACP5E4_04475, partial [Candidatus Aenigmatarchaeota archaeon]